MSQQDFEKLKGFLEDREVARRAAKPLKDGAYFQMTIHGDPQAYYVCREKKQTLLKEGEAPKDPAVSFTISPKAIDALVDFDTDSIGEYGIHFFKQMVSDDPDIVLKARLHTGFIGLTRIGVFGVLALGGSGVMTFLAKQGLKSLKDIRKAVSKLRGSD